MYPGVYLGGQQGIGRPPSLERYKLGAWINRIHPYKPDTPQIHPRYTPGYTPDTHWIHPRYTLDTHGSGSKQGTGGDKVGGLGVSGIYLGFIQSMGTLGVSAIYLGFIQSIDTLDAPKIHLRCTPGYTLDTPHIHPRYSPDTPGPGAIGVAKGHQPSVVFEVRSWVYLRCIHGTSEVYLGCIFSVSGVYLECIWLF